MNVEVYTDGSSKGNPGPGGFGIVMIFGSKRKEISQGFRLTTNNRMELMAIVIVLETLKSKKHPVHITSDSKYVIDSITKGWVYSWVKKKFKGKKNKDLWLRYIAAEKGYKLSFTWVKGHAGHVENERCDQLAVLAADLGPWKEDVGYNDEAASENDLFN